jgi:hypothetical protein
VSLGVEVVHSEIRETHVSASGWCASRSFQAWLPVWASRPSKMDVLAAVSMIFP